MRTAGTAEERPPPLEEEANPPGNGQVRQRKGAASLLRFQTLSGCSPTGADLPNTAGNYLGAIDYATPAITTRSPRQESGTAGKCEGEGSERRRTAGTVGSGGTLERDRSGVGTPVIAQHGCREARDQPEVGTGDS